MARCHSETGEALVRWLSGSRVPTRRVKLSNVTILKGIAGFASQAAGRGLLATGEFEGDTLHGEIASGGLSPARRSEAGAHTGIWGTEFMGADGFRVHVGERG